MNIMRNNEGQKQKNEKLLELVLKAISKTDKKYYIRLKYGNKCYERNFCYEFYHQFRALMSGNYDDCILSGEPYKAIEEDLNNIITLLDEKLEHSSKEEKTQYVSPDIILHGGLADIDEKKQYMVLEAKCEINKTNVSYDIEKLFLLIVILRFKMGIFLAIGITESKMKEILSDIFCSYNYSNMYGFENIYNKARTKFPQLKNGVPTSDVIKCITSSIYIVTIHPIRDNKNITDICVNQFLLDDYLSEIHV